MRIKKIVKINVAIGYSALVALIITTLLLSVELNNDSAFLNVLMGLNIVGFVCLPYAYLIRANKVSNESTCRNNNMKINALKVCSFCLCFIGAHVALFSVLFTEQGAAGTISPLIFLLGSYNILESCLKDIEVKEQKPTNSPPLKMLGVLFIIGIILAFLLINALLHSL